MTQPIDILLLLDSYQLQKYRGAGLFVLPVDPKDKETWADSEHRLAYVNETTVIFKGVVEKRDKQWWQLLPLFKNWICPF